MINPRSTWSNTRIDRLGDQLRREEFSVGLLTDLDEYRTSFEAAYELVVARLRSLNYSVTGRPAKSTTALVDKLQRQHVRLSQVQDIAGCRVVVEDIVIQDRALNAIDVYLDNPTIYDRRDNPSNGYRAIHAVSLVGGRKVEVQIRTELQHLWAEISEKIADTVGAEIKYGSGDPSSLLLLSNLSTAVHRVEQEEAARQVFMNKLNLSGASINKKAKKEIRGMERRFFEQRSRLTRLLKDIHADFSRQEAA